MIIAPGVTGTDSKCARTVDFVDLYPTLAELCGLPIGRHLDGESLVPLLKQPDREWPHAALTTHGRLNHAVRTERWRYIRYADGSEELYDHDKDPMEWTNLGTHPDFGNVRKQLAAQLPQENAADAPFDKNLRSNRNTKKKKK